MKGWVDLVGWPAADIGSRKYHAFDFLTSWISSTPSTITSCDYVVVAWSVLSWLKSYPSSQSFCNNCDSSLSSLYSSSSRVPHGSVLGPLLLIMYTTLLSALISSLYLNHHLYADDTQLFFSFHQPDFDSSITYLQNALQQIISWITANLLILNTSKTKLLLIRLSKQLAEILNSSVKTTHSAGNHGFTVY